MRSVEHPAAAPRWAAPVTLTLLLAGLCISAYLTLEHYTAAVTLICPAGKVLNCAQVTTSPQSYLVGLPVALLGLLFFAGMLPLHLPVAWRSTNRLLRTARVLGWAGGVAMVIWLVYAEFVLIGAVCVWCTAVHVLTLALFTATAAATALSGGDVDDDVDHPGRR